MVPQWLKVISVVALLTTLAANFGVITATYFGQLQYVTPQDAPRIPTDQKTDSAVQDQQDSNRLKDSSEPTYAATTGPLGANNAPEHTEHGSEEGTEFWPPFLGFRVKVTDSLLILFNFALAVFTYKLGKSTDKLWWASREQSDDMKRSLAIAKEAADAARDSAKAAMQAADVSLSLNEPRLILQSLEIVAMRSTRREKGLPEEGYPLAVFHNFGDSPAFVSRTCLYCEATLTPEKWDRHFYLRFPTHMIRAWPAGTTINKGSDFVVAARNSPIIIDDATQRAIESPESALYGYLLIVFSDLFGRETTYEQLLVYHPFDYLSASLRRGFVHYASRRSTKDGEPPQP